MSISRIVIIGLLFTSVSSLANDLGQKVRPSVAPELFVGAIIPADPQSDTDRFTVRVDGMGCPYCAYGLEKKLKELPEAVSDIDVVMETGILTFRYPSGASLSLEQVSRQVDAAGYTAVRISVVRADGTEEAYEADRS
jgi:copper chaperone CopZ